LSNGKLLRALALEKNVLFQVAEEKKIVFDKSVYFVYNTIDLTVKMGIVYLFRSR